MNSLLFALLALALSPTVARADLAYKCKSVKFSDQTEAHLRFDESGQGGSVEVLYWNGYPPITLVAQKLKAPTLKTGRVIFLSEIEPPFGKQAEVDLPESFLRNGSFLANITLINGQNRQKIAYNCNRS